MYHQNLTKHSGQHFNSKRNLIANMRPFLQEIFCSSFFIDFDCVTNHLQILYDHNNVKLKKCSIRLLSHSSFIRHLCQQNCLMNLSLSDCLSNHPFKKIRSQRFVKLQWCQNPIFEKKSSLVKWVQKFQWLLKKTF